jgi:hypothetical protein
MSHEVTPMLTVTGIRAHTFTTQSVVVTLVGVAGSEPVKEQVDCCRTVEVPFRSFTQTWFAFVRLPADRPTVFAWTAELQLPYPAGVGDVAVVAP